MLGLIGVGRLRGLGRTGWMQLKGCSGLGDCGSSQGSGSWHGWDDTYAVNARGGLGCWDGLHPNVSFWQSTLGGLGVGSTWPAHLPHKIWLLRAFHKLFF